MKKIYAATVILLAVSVSSFGQDAVFPSARDKEKVIALLYDSDENRTKYGNEIISIEEFNFGIPGGINWLVEWEGEQRIYPYIYVIDYSVDIGVWEIRLREFIIGSISLNNRPGDWDFYEGIPEDFPGVTKGNGVYQIGDFNGDGFDEIAAFVGQAISPSFVIEGYDPQEGKIKEYCDIPYGSIKNKDWNFWEPPVKFISYKGMQGFQLYFTVLEVAGGPDWVPDPDPRNGRWFFYTWDEERRKYVVIEEVDPKHIGVYTKPARQDVPPPVVVVEEPPVEAAIAAEPLEETALSVVEDSNKSKKLIFIIVRIIGVIALVAGIIFVAARKRRLR